ncbi:hypothetical protein CATMIT_01952, partial [Catenibacterium mitsuokai DSM 15897]
MAAALEVAEHLRAGDGEDRVVAHRHDGRLRLALADAYLHLVLAGLLRIGEVDAEIALARAPLDERRQRLQLALLDRLA